MLYVVMLGGKHPRAKIEVHDVVFASGNSLPDTYLQLYEQWFGDPDYCHIDSWMAVDGVDQYKVSLRPVLPGPEQPRLFFINLGGYVRGVFGEEHRYLLVTAFDAHSAKEQGKRQISKHWEKPHTDAVLAVDDCMPIDTVGNLFVHLDQDASHRGIVSGNDYIILGPEGPVPR